MKLFLIKILLPIVCLTFFTALSPTASAAEPDDYDYGPWFGDFWYGSFGSDQKNGWAWHYEHEWIYLAEASESSFWMWDSRISWTWTSASIYPYFYSYARGSWIWYYRGTRIPRWFVDIAEPDIPFRDSDPTPEPTPMPPTVPTGLIATEVGPDFVVLEWSPSSDALGVTGYTIRSDGSAPISTELTSVTITGLEPETTFSFTVSAMNEAGLESDPSDPIEVTTEALLDDLIAYEPFDYIVSTIREKDGGTGWATPWADSNNDVRIETANALTYADADDNILVTDGLGMRIPRTLRHASRDLPELANAEGTIWMSFLMEPLFELTENSNLRLHLRSGDTSRVILGKFDSVPNYALDAQSHTVQTSVSGEESVDGVFPTRLFVLKYNVGTGADDGSAYLFIDPVLGHDNEPSEQDADAAITGLNSDIMAFDRIYIRADGPSVPTSASQGRFDEIRFGRTYASVTPSQALVAPVITFQPWSSTVETGDTAHLIVEAVGHPEPTFQWRKDGEDMPGETSNQLIISNAQVGHAGTYDVVVTNARGVATSSEVELNVVASLSAVAGCDVLQPGQIGEGQSISLTVPIIAVVPPSNSASAVFDWEFNSGGGDAYCGKFANGDYWIAPKATSEVTITGLATNNGIVTADADPVMETTGLMDGAEKRYGNHDASQNIVTHLPISYSKVTSIVAAKQRNEEATGACGTAGTVGGCIDAYHIVTILPSIPPNNGADMIRPNITGETKEILTLSDFDFSRLPSSSLLNGTTVSGLETIRKRWSHSTGIFGFSFQVYTSEGNRAFRPMIVHGEYAAGMASRELNPDVLALFSSQRTLEEKLPALAAMISYGLDIYHARYNGPPSPDRKRGWASGAGQHLGAFLPPALMAALRIDQTAADVLKQAGPNAHADDPLDRGPQEMQQIALGRDGAIIWGDIRTDTSTFEQPSALEERYYWTNLFTGQCYHNAPGSCYSPPGQNSRDPYQYTDAAEFRAGDGYIQVSLGSIRGFAAISCVMPELREIVNYPRLYQYLDRVRSHGVWSQPDECAAPPANENPECSPWGNDGLGSNCTYYRVTWGPDPNNPGDCIKNGIGRFPARHGANLPATGAYVTGEVESKWTQLRALCP